MDRVLGAGRMADPYLRVHAVKYDFLDLGQERLGLVIGDIAGKGMPGRS